jgi:hypothetical protein
MEHDGAARPNRLGPDFSARKSGTGPRVKRRTAGTPGRSPADPSPTERRNRVAIHLTLAAAIWSFGLVIAAVALPVYETTTTTSVAGTTFINTTLVAGQGAWVLIPVLVPLVITGGVALALRRRRAGAGVRHSQIAWASVGLLVVFSLLSILSIGGFVLPVALLLGRATMLTRPRDAPPGETTPARTAPAPTPPPDAPPAPKSLWARP